MTDAAAEGCGSCPKCGSLSPWRCGCFDPECPRCGGGVHRCKTGDEGCYHCDDFEGCGWSGFLETDPATYSEDTPQGSEVADSGAYRTAEVQTVEIFSVFVITLGSESWEWEGEPGSKISIFNGFEEEVNDFLLGTFSSEEKAEANLAEYLAGYRIGDEDDEHVEPIRGVTLWKTELDAGSAEGEFVRWMRGSEGEIPEYPYS